MSETLTLREKLVLRILLLCAEMLTMDDKIRVAISNLSFSIRSGESK